MRRDASGTPVAPEAPTLTAEGAEVRAGSPLPPLSTFLVVPQPGARTVVLHARAGALQAEARYAVGPPASRVTLALEPPEPVKGRDKEASLTVRLLRPDGTPDDSGAPPVVRVNVGRVEGLARTEPGTYRARYVLPATTYPEVAILVALSSWPHPQSIFGAYGKMLVPLAAAVELAGKTEPDSKISLTIDRQTFGPAQAGADGRFVLPVVVPPGHPTAQSRVVDPAGNVERKPFNLGLPPTDGLACVLNPARLPADGASRARLLCAASDPLGRPVPDARVNAKARYGTLKGPDRAEGGLLEWIYTAPRELPSTPENIQAAWPQGGASSREELSLQLVQGPVAKVSAALTDPQVFFGGSVGVTVAVEDAFGRPRPGAKASVSKGSPLVEERPGFFRSTWTLPADQDVYQKGGGVGPGGFDSKATVQVTAFGPTGTEPARITAWRRDSQLYVGVSDLAGLPIPAQPLKINGKEQVTGADGTLLLGDANGSGKIEVVHGVWPGLRKVIHLLGPSGIYPLDPPLAPAPVTLEVQLLPSVPVDVHLEVKGNRVTYWVADLQGNVIPKRPVYVALTSGRQEASETHEGRTSFTVMGAAPGGSSVSVADMQTGVTMTSKVKP